MPRYILTSLILTIAFPVIFGIGEFISIGWQWHEGWQGKNPSIDQLAMKIHDKNYEIKLINGSAMILSTAGSEISWQSPDHWDVREAFFADLDRDGINEAVLLVWRPFSPWPIDAYIPVDGRIESFHDSLGNSCHLILVGLVHGKFQEIWAGSAMADPIHQIRAMDSNGDGFLELAALEYRYNDDVSKSNLVIWGWNGFGFSLEKRISGNYRFLSVNMFAHQ